MRARNVRSPQFCALCFWFSPSAFRFCGLRPFRLFPRCRSMLPCLASFLFLAFALRRISVAFLWRRCEATRRCPFCGLHPSPSRASVYELVYVARCTRLRRQIPPRLLRFSGRGATVTAGLCVDELRVRHPLKGCQPRMREIAAHTPFDNRRQVKTIRSRFGDSSSRHLSFLVLDPGAAALLASAFSRSFPFMLSQAENHDMIRYPSQTLHRGNMV